MPSLLSNIPEDSTVDVDIPVPSMPAPAPPAKSVDATHHSSIRLSQLDPYSRDRLAKFDVSNDGALNIEESLQALITLQKQSNNYKKILYMLVPVFIMTLLCVFGLTVLALNITKEMKVSDGALESSSTSRVVRATSALQSGSLYESMLSSIDLASTTKTLVIGSTSLSVKSVHQDVANNVAYFHTSIGVISLNATDMDMKAEVYDFMKTDPVATMVMNEVHNIVKYSAYSYSEALKKAGITKVSTSIKVGSIKATTTESRTCTWSDCPNDYATSSSGNTICDPYNVCVSSTTTLPPPPPPPKPYDEDGNPIE